MSITEEEDVELQEVKISHESPHSHSHSKKNPLKKLAPQKQMTFDFMRNDTHPLIGLEDWSSVQWCQQFLKDTHETDKFLCSFFPTGAQITKEVEDILNGPHSREEKYEKLADMVTERLNLPLPSFAWKAVTMYQNQCVNSGREDVARVYIDPRLRANLIFDRDFPLGVEHHLICDEKKQANFALEHSGVSSVTHDDSSWMTMFVYLIILGGIGATIAMLIIYLAKPIWDIESTVILDTKNSTQAQAVLARTKDRAFVASMFATLSFSLTINASIDKFGQIDPSTSTVLIGMTLGNTFGFVLDNLLGSDEGFREYLWSAMDGMKYAVGSLGTERYARYLVTILFDMFFTVIIFKRLYCVIVRLAGFSKNGREWIANGLTSTVISFLTFKVYANMTRLEWAYPSGVEQLNNQWISGSTMILAVVTMSIVYLIDESRSSFGERGINDPPIKVAVVLLTFCLLMGLQAYGIADPSEDGSLASNITTNDMATLSNFHLKLKGVCDTEKRFFHGFCILIAVIVGCLGFVIFVTSKQTTKGLKASCGCCKKDDKEELGGPQEEAGSLKVKLLLFLIYGACCCGVLAFFSLIPIFPAPNMKRQNFTCPE